MDSTHFHLLLNHFPIIGTLLGTGVMVFGYLTNSESTKKAALMNWVIMAAIAIPVFLTGEPAEEKVEGIAGVSEAMIEAHEEAAEVAIWAIEALGLLSLAALLLLFRGSAASNLMVGISMVLSLVVFGLMARTGYLGGQIRHSEIRSGMDISIATDGTGTLQKEDDD